MEKKEYSEAVISGSMPFTYSIWAAFNKDTAEEWEKAAADAYLLPLLGGRSQKMHVYLPNGAAHEYELVTDTSDHTYNLRRTYVPKFNARYTSEEILRTVKYADAALIVKEFDVLRIKLSEKRKEEY